MGDGPTVTLTKSEGQVAEGNQAVFTVTRITALGLLRFI